MLKKFAQSCLLTIWIKLDTLLKKIRWLHLLTSIVMLWPLVLVYLQLSIKFCNGDRLVLRLWDINLSNLKTAAILSISIPLLAIFIYILDHPSDFVLEYSHTYAVYSTIGSVLLIFIGCCWLGYYFETINIPICFAAFCAFYFELFKLFSTHINVLYNDED